LYAGGGAGRGLTGKIRLQKGGTPYKSEGHVTPKEDEYKKICLVKI